MRRWLGLIALSASLALLPSCAPQPSPVKPAKDKDAKAKVEPIPAVPVDNVLQRVNLAIDNVEKRDLKSSYGFWTIFHGILGMGPGVTLYDPESKTRVNALDEIARGANIPGVKFIPTPHGLDVQTQSGTGTGQGHQDQFVAEMVQWGTPLSRKFVVNGKDYTFGDFINHSMMRTSPNPDHAAPNSTLELSWAIVIVAEHFGTNHKWTNMYNEPMKFEDVVRYELDQPIDPPAACGGTHRLFGLTWAYHRHLKAGGKVEGIWKDVDDKIEHYKKRARELRNSDGSFSTNYVSSAGMDPDPQSRINSSGHVLEWLALAMTDEELKKEWVQDAANALAMMIIQNEKVGINGGGLYHAMHGLYMYRARVYGVPGPPGLLIPMPK